MLSDTRNFYPIPSTLTKKYLDPISRIFQKHKICQINDSKYTTFRNLWNIYTLDQFTKNLTRRYIRNPTESEITQEVVNARVCQAFQLLVATFSSMNLAFESNRHRADISKVSNECQYLGKYTVSEPIRVVSDNTTENRH